jgi:hypothetical protein
VKKQRLTLVLSIAAGLALLAMLLPQVVLAGSGGLVNPGFEDGFSGWNKGTVSDGVYILGSGQGTFPPEGDHMACLGTPAHRSDITQPTGPNEIYQDFIANEPYLVFKYNIYTWDYDPFNHFEYKLTRGGNIIASYSQSAWGYPGDGLKSTGWQEVTIDISAYQGQSLRLLLSCGGTFDSRYPTWAFIDTRSYIQAPGMSPWGLIGLAVLMGGMMVWLMRGRLPRRGTR